MKKLFTLLLAAAILLAALAACSSGENATTATTAPTAETLTGETETAVLSDDEAMAAYLEKLHSKNYEDRLYDYEDLTVYFSPTVYKGVEYPAARELETEIPDQEVEDYIVFLVLDNFAAEDTYEELTEGKVQRYDTAVIDYVGYIDGEAADKAADTDMELQIGSNTFVHGFEDALIGVSVGETVSIDLHFSPYYADTSAADKDVTFDVTVKAIRRPTIPEVTVEMINENWNTAYETFDEFRAAVKNDLGEERADNARAAIKKYLQNRIVATAEIGELPEKELQHFRDQFDAYYMQYASYYGMDLETFVSSAMGATMEMYEAKRESFARGSVLTDLYTFVIAQLEGIEWTDEQVEALVRGTYENLSSSFGSLQDVVEYYTSVYSTTYFPDNILNQMVNQFVVDNAVGPVQRED